MADGTATPDVATCTFSLPAPTPSGDAGVSPTVLSATFSLQTATITGSGTATPKRLRLKMRMHSPGALAVPPGRRPTTVGDGYAP